MALLPLLKPMAQSRRGALHMLEAQVRLLVVAILRFIQLMVLIEPSTLTAAKAYPGE
jgi:hypothetical protein